MAMDRRSALVAAGALLTGGRSGAGSATRRGRANSTATAKGDTDGYAPLGSVDVPGARDVAVAGEVAYVAAGDGFAVVDISDPENPELLAQHRDVDTGTDRRLTGIWDVWPWEDRLAVAGPAQFDPDTPDGVALFDVSDPATPQQVAFHPTESYNHNTYFEDGIVYLTGRDEGMSLVMVDVTDDDPVEVGRWSPLSVDSRWAEVEPSLRLLHDVYVRDGMAYLPYWDAGTWLVDVSDPGDATAVGHVHSPGYTRERLAAIEPEQASLVARTPRGADHYAQVDPDGEVMLVGRETWAVDDTDGVLGPAGRRVGGASGIDLYDVTDPSAPTHLATIDAPDSFDQTTSGWFTTSHNADIRDGRLYTSWYFGGVAIHDVSDPANPVELARWHDPRETSFWTAQAAEDAVVASSAAISGVFRVPNDTREALYLFPDEAGTQADPPALTDWPTDLLGSEPDDRPAVEWAGGSVTELVGTGDPADGDDGTAGGDDGSDIGDRSDDDTTGDAAGPGLGVGAAVSGVAGYLLARRAGQLSESPEE